MDRRFPLLRLRLEGCGSDENRGRLDQTALRLTSPLAAAHTSDDHARRSGDPVASARECRGAGVRGDRCAAPARRGGVRRPRVRGRAGRDAGVRRDGRRAVGHRFDDGVNRRHGPLSLGPDAIGTPSGDGKRSRPGAVPPHRDGASFAISAATGHSPRSRRVLSRATRVVRG